MKICFLGDVMLGRGVNEASKHMSPQDHWGDTLELLSLADLRIINLECAITDYNTPWTKTPKVFHFRAEPRAVEILKAARIDICSLANNHTLDFCEQGLLDTRDYLLRAGICPVGAGKDIYEASKPCLVKAGNFTVGVVAFTDNEPPFAAGENKPGTNYLEVSLDPSILTKVERTIQQTRDLGADIVIFSDHWGPNMRLRPSPLFKQFARRVIELGADVFYGHSAHIFQGIEIYQHKPILYDTGDFIDDYAVDPVLHNDWSFVFECSFDGYSFSSLTLYPVKLSFARVQRARGQECQQIIQRMLELSAELGTKLEVHDEFMMYQA